MIEKLFGKRIIAMCDLFDKTIPENTPECNTIKSGLGSIMSLLFGIGFLAGTLTAIFFGLVVIYMGTTGV